jgi:hypothetical protein
LGDHGSPVRIQRHLAIGHQHWDDHRDIPDGVSDPGNPDRDTLALQLKLDELILATRDARNQIAGIEEAPDEQIEREKAAVLQKLPKKASTRARREKIGS